MPTWNNNLNEGGANKKFTWYRQIITFWLVCLQYIMTNLHTWHTSCAPNWWDQLDNEKNWLLTASYRNKLINKCICRHKSKITGRMTIILTTKILETNFYQDDSPRYYFDKLISTQKFADGGSWITAANILKYCQALQNWLRKGK